MVTRTKKIFVGGLSANTVVEDVKQYFEQFGKVRSHWVFFFSSSLSVAKLRERDLRVRCVNACSLDPALRNGAFIVILGIM